MLFLPVPGLTKEYKHPYWKILSMLQDKPSEEARLILRHYFLTDVFFMCYFGMNRRDINRQTKPFLIRACKAVDEGPPSGTLDLWARGHYKSTIITQGKSLQDVLGDPEHRLGIFSHTRPSAKGFLRPIKHALETNKVLRWVFSDVIWENPRREAPIWSLDDGLVLKRPSESNTANFEAWGLVDGMPTGKHFSIRVYDDVITEHTVTTPEMMRKAEDSFRLSNNLSDGKYQWERTVGTIYANGDFYSKAREDYEKGVVDWHIREMPWYDVTTFAKSGVKVPVLLTKEQIDEKYIKQGPRIFACQMELNPFAEGQAEFQRSWLQYYGVLPKKMKIWILVDPANEKKKDSDMTAIVVVGKDEFKNRYVLDIVRDRLNLYERWTELVRMKRKWKKAVVYYERYGKDADISYYKEKMKDSGVNFRINEMGGRASKKDRIRRLIPIAKAGWLYLPMEPIYYNGEDMVEYLIEHEYSPFPFSRYFDVLDALARIEDPDVKSRGPEADSGSAGEMHKLREHMIQRRHAAGV